jgi:hypothetical protein
MIRLIAGSILGILGAIVFVNAFYPYPFASLPPYDNQKYSGVVISQDVANKTLTVAIRGNYPDSAGSVPVRIKYDDKTLWASFDFVTQGDTTVRKVNNYEKERELPAGSLVSFVVRYAAGDFSAAAIAYLKRSQA